MDISKIIKKKKMTNAGFAEAVRVTENTVYCWRSGKHKVNRLNQLVIQIWLDGGDCHATFTREEWEPYRKNYTVKELSEMTDLDIGTIHRMHGEKEFSTRIQIILRNRLG
jgi:DNA-binding Xre family transcriptional regulator